MINLPEYLNLKFLKGKSIFKDILTMKRSSIVRFKFIVFFHALTALEIFNVNFKFEKEFIRCCTRCFQPSKILKDFLKKNKQIWLFGEWIANQAQKWWISKPN